MALTIEQCKVAACAEWCRHRIIVFCLQDYSNVKPRFDTGLQQQGPAMADTIISRSYFTSTSAWDTSSGRPISAPVPEPVVQEAARRRSPYGTLDQATHDALRVLPVPGKEAVKQVHTRVQVKCVQASATGACEHMLATQRHSWVRRVQAPARHTQRVGGSLEKSAERQHDTTACLAGGNRTTTSSHPHKGGRGAPQEPPAHTWTAPPVMGELDASQPLSVAAATKPVERVATEPAEDTTEAPCSDQGGMAEDVTFQNQSAPSLQYVEDDAHRPGQEVLPPAEATLEVQGDGNSWEEEMARAEQLNAERARFEAQNIVARVAEVCLSGCIYIESSSCGP